MIAIARASGEAPSSRRSARSVLSTAGVGEVNAVSSDRRLGIGPPQVSLAGPLHCAATSHVTNAGAPRRTEAGNAATDHHRPWVSGIQRGDCSVCRGDGRRTVRPLRERSGELGRGRGARRRRARVRDRRSGGDLRHPRPPRPLGRRRGARAPQRLHRLRPPGRGGAPDRPRSQAPAERRAALRRPARFPCGDGPRACPRDS